MMRKLRERGFSGTTDTEVSSREEAHRKIAGEAAEEGFVLLKNEGLLPLEKGMKAALYGRGVSYTVKGGTGSGDVNERKSVSIYEGMKAAGFVITNEDWIREYEKAYDAARKEWKNDIIRRSEESGKAFFDVYAATPFLPPTGKPVEKTEADTAIYVLSRIAGEGADRFEKEGDYYLTREEEAMLRDICNLYPKVLLVINTGGVVDLSFLDEAYGRSIRAVLQISQPGMEGGNAFARCVTGEVTPSGKLTDSWAYHYSDYPGAASFSHNNGKLDVAEYEEGIYVGYRYFDSFEIPVRFGFGYGLSYTKFDIRMKSAELIREKSGIAPEVKISEAELCRIKVKVSVKNTGDKMAGKEVVQVYVSLPVGKLDKEHRRLCAFQKTGLLAPGEEEELELSIPLYSLASFDETGGAYILEPGYYGIWVGNSLQESRLCAGLRVSREEILVKTEHICPLKQKLSGKKPDKEIAEKYYKREKAALEEGLPVLELLPGSLKTEIKEYTGKLQENTREAAELVESLTTEQLLRLASGDPVRGHNSALGAAGATVPGSAGETHHCAAAQNLAGITLADGPAGLRLLKYYHVENGKVLPMPFRFALEGGFFYEDGDKLPGTRYYQYCTAIPVGTALAQTWNEELIERTGRMVGAEMEYFGVTLWLAPGMNIHRNPLCGRNFEYYAEDPLLSGKMAAAMTRGVQSVPGCGTTIKHFACNNQEDNRLHCDSVLSERALREIYLKGFEIAVKESQPMSIMTSYNKINGVHTANSYDLCTKAARDEWGFAGVIMTDWTTTHNDPECTGAGCIKAGNDLIMPGEESDYESIKKELESGVLSREQLRDCVIRLAHIILCSNQYEAAVPYLETLKEK